MTRTRVATCLVLFAIVGTGASPPAAAATTERWTRTVTRAYASGDLGPLLGSSQGCGDPERKALGTVCFGYPHGDYFSVTIKDDSGRKVGGVLRITDSGGWTVKYRPFCGTSGLIRLVPGQLSVYLDAPGDVSYAHWFGGPGCRDIEPLGATYGATSGVVQARFTGRY